MKKSLITLLAVAMLASGCATANRGTGAQWQPVVDIRAEQAAQYPQDLSQCQALSTQVLAAHEAAVNGAIGGAIVGALLGAAAGNRGFAGRMAGVGAVSGGASAAAAAEGGQRGIISRCLAGRGYSVLN